MAVDFHDGDKPDKFLDEQRQKIIAVFGIHRCWRCDCFVRADATRLYGSGLYACDGCEPAYTQWVIEFGLARVRNKGSGIA